LTADTRDFDRAMDRSEKGMGRFGSAVKLGAIGAGAAIGVSLYKAAKIGFGEFAEGQRVAAQTGAVLKSTGGVANVTAKEVDKLSTSLMRKSGVDDGQVKTGANMLLTFTKIRNETGAGNRIFDQATKATLNLSVAMGKDMQSSALLVGKALNDPIKGMASLGRAGVQFTEEQKATIKTLVATGDTMGAQKVILKELETQFGGSAEAAGQTFGGQINIAKESLTNLAGEGVGKLMPKLTDFATWITETALPKLKDFVKGLTGNESVKGALKGVKEFLDESFFPAIKGIAKVFTTALGTVKKVLDEKKPELETIFGGIKAAAEGIYTIFNAVIIPGLKEIFKEGGVFDIAFGLAITIIAGVVTAVTKISGAIKTTFEAVDKFMTKTAIPAFEKAWGLIKAPIDAVLESVRAILDTIKDVVKWIGKIKVPGVGSGPSIEEIFPGKGSSELAGAAVSGVNSGLWDEVALGKGMGLTLTSGFRPGDPGDHGKHNAVDMAGPASTMASYAMAVMGRPGVKDVIYGGLNFWQDNGRRILGWAGNEALRSDHYDHVHASIFDKGGWLAPFSKTLAINRTPHWEPVGPPGRAGGLTIEVHNHGTVIEQARWQEEIVYAIRRARNLGWAI
jgi:Flp pilus assembly pilin Flp